MREYLCSQISFLILDFIKLFSKSEILPTSAATARALFHMTLHLCYYAVLDDDNFMSWRHDMNRRTVVLGTLHFCKQISEPWCHRRLFLHYSSISVSGEFVGKGLTLLCPSHSKPMQFYGIFLCIKMNKWFI